MNAEIPTEPIFEAALCAARCQRMAAIIRGLKATEAHVLAAHTFRGGWRMPKGPLK